MAIKCERKIFCSRCCCRNTIRHYPATLCQYYFHSSAVPFATSFLQSRLCARAQARPLRYGIYIHPHDDGKRIEGHKSSETKQIERSEDRKNRGKSFSRQFSTSFQTNKRFHSFFLFHFLSISSSFINALLFIFFGHVDERARLNSFISHFCISL